MELYYCCNCGNKFDDFDLTYNQDKEVRGIDGEYDCPRCYHDLEKICSDVDDFDE